MLPVALLRKLGWVHIFPARLLGEFIVGLCVFFFFRLSIVKPTQSVEEFFSRYFPSSGLGRGATSGLAAMAARSRFRAARRGGSTLLHSGPTFSSYGRSVFRARFWEPNRNDFDLSSLSLSVVGHCCRW